MNFFESYKIDNNITCIKGVVFDELMYLIEGTERAVLIDTGLGVGNIRKYVDSLTSLPYIVLHTHVHLDHIGGSFLYESVYINAKDFSLLNNLDRDVKRRKSYIESTYKNGCVQENDYIPVRQIEFLTIEDKDMFELGEITVESIITPGHTKGSLSFLIKEKRILITGDACNPFTMVFLDESTSIEEYQTSLLNLLERADEYDEVYVSHTYHKVPKSIIQDAYDCCTDIIIGNTDDIPFEFFGQEAGQECYMAKTQNANGIREDGKLVNIFYSKKKIYTENAYQTKFTQDELIAIEAVLSN